MRPLISRVLAPPSTTLTPMEKKDSPQGVISQWMPWRFSVLQFECGARARSLQIGVVAQPASRGVAAHNNNSVYSVHRAIPRRWIVHWSTLSPCQNGHGNVRDPRLAAPSVVVEFVLFKSSGETSRWNMLVRTLAISRR